MRASPASGRGAAGARRHPLRSSLAARLLAGGLLFTAVLIAGVSALLLVSRSQQTQAGALSNADNRAAVAAQLIARVTEPQAQYAATSLATLPSLRTALSGTSPAAAVAQEFAMKQAVAVPGLSAIVLDLHGRVLYTTECDTLDAAGHTQHPATSSCESPTAPRVTASAGSVQAALSLGRSAACAAGRASCPPGVEGVEMLGQAAPAFDVAVPVQQPGGAPLGVVVYSAPLSSAFQRFGPVIGYTPVFYVAGSHPELVRFSGHGDTPAASAPPAVVAAQATLRTAGADGSVAAHAVYPAPGGGDVAGSFVAMAAPGGTRTAGYLGVEVPLSLFAAATAQDERTIAEIAVIAMAVVSLLVLLFVDRFVRRPVGRLERAVSRIAAGDYSQEIPVTSQDELGRLAVSVNRMRLQIAGYVRHIDGSIAQLQDVSRALTTTTGGVNRLQDAVLRAATLSAGSGATASLLTRRGDDLFVTDMHGEAKARVLDPATVATIVGGRTVRIDRKGQHLLAVPMFYQGSVNGALVLVSEQAVFESDQKTLEALANNAAVALENTRLFEQEKVTVERLSELNQMKSEFLGTAQHELRTPVLAIQGQLQLLTLAWERWDEAAKLDILRDIEISTRLLDELLETVVDFSLLSADTVELRPDSVDVGQAAADALADVRGHFKDGLPVEVTCFIADTAVVRADPARFRKVLRSLFDNAVKFTPEGGHVTVQAHAEHAGAVCRIDVIDDGDGIAPEALPRVFDRFFQADGSRTRKYGGMGMGLALVQRLCEAHGATVSVQSELGKGSRFTLVWPLAPAVTRSRHEVPPLRGASLAG